MKYITRIIGCAVFICTAVLLSGCLRDADINDDGKNIADGTGKDVEVVMRLNVPGASATRGLSSTQEEAVNNIDIFVFDKNLKLTDWQYGQLEDNAGSVSFSALLKASKDSDDKFRIMVLANVRNVTYPIFQGTDFGGHKGETYGEICALLLAAVPSYSGVSSNGIPMWGEIENMILLNANTGNNYSIDLLRSLARVDVGTNPTPTFAASGQITGWAALDNFSLEEVYIYNASSTYALPTNRANYSYTDKKVSAVSLPSPNNKNASPVLYSDGQLSGTVTRSNDDMGYGITGAIYTGEANVIMSGTYGDGNHVSRMALVVAGYYSPDPLTPNTTDLSYYRLDLLNGTNSTALMDIMRNRDYQVVIRSVSGPGSTTKEEAFTKFNADMVAVIRTWVPANQGTTVVDGQNWLSVDRYDIETDKWAKNDEQVVITTNTSSGWTATVSEGSAWLTLAGGTTVTGADGDELSFDIAQIPDGTTSRTGKIKITAGNMSLSVLIRQTNADSDFRLRISRAEFLFPGRVWDAEGGIWTAPGTETLTVDWAPRVNDYGMSLASYVGGGVEGFSPGNTSSNPTVTVGLSMIDPDGEKVQADPFYERSSLLTLTAWNLDGLETITKQVLIRQVFYSVVVTGTEDYYFQRKTYTLNIKANSAWTASVSGANVFASDPSASGTGNTSTGENLSFTISSTATPNSSAVITISSPGNLFAPQQFTIVAQDEQSNCYFLTPETGEITIPVNKAYRVWKYDRDLKDINTGGDLPTGSKGVKLLWQDSPGLVTVNFVPAPAPGVIRVTAGTGTGNAVVAFTIDDEIYWSWHIWVTDEGSIATHSVNGQTIMDRHIGSLNAIPGDPGIVGLYFQAGRKDPFSLSDNLTNLVRRTLYDEYGVALPGTASGGGIYTDNAPATGGLPISVQNPTQIMAGPYGTFDWYGPLSDGRSFLWSPWLKTDYDPCPEGWRIGNETTYINMSAGRVTYDSSRKNFVWQGMNFPAQGATSINGTVWWQKNQYSWIRHASDTGIVKSRVCYDNGTVSGNGSRSVCAPARCIRDQ